MNKKNEKIGKIDTNYTAIQTFLLFLNSIANVYFIKLLYQKWEKKYTIKQKAMFSSKSLLYLLES